MAIVRLGRFRRLATFSIATVASLWAVEHYSDANSVWSSFRVVRFGRAAIAVSHYKIFLAFRYCIHTNYRHYMIPYCYRYVIM